jgi:photosystem II stability/assembly factor-like uncharacterized protein
MNVSHVTKIRSFLRVSSILLIVLFTLLGCGILTSPSSELWIEYTLPGNSGYINDICFSSDSDGWACTSNGYIYRYDGTDWSLSVHFKPKDGTGGSRYFEIHDIDFSSPDDGWAVARTSSYPYQSGIFHYDGETWFDVTPDNIESYGMYAVYAVAPDDVWFGGALGVLIHYDGTSFETVEGPSGGKIWAIQFVDKNFGIAAESGQLLYYDGMSWRNDVYPICNIGIGNQGGLCFTSKENGWVVGAMEGGPELPSYPVAIHFDGERWCEVDITTEHITFNDVYSKDGKEIWIVGTDVRKNEGKKWDRIEIPQYLGAFCVHVTETGDVWVGCNNGTILKYKG